MPALIHLPLACRCALSDWQRALIRIRYNEEAQGTKLRAASLISLSGCIGEGTAQFGEGPLVWRLDVTRCMKSV